MTTVNNFDTSSTGTDLELSIFYDTELSLLYYDEAFLTIEYPLRGTPILFWSAYGQWKDAPINADDYLDTNDCKQTTAKRWLVDRMADGKYRTVRDVLREVRDDWDGDAIEYMREELREISIGEIVRDGADSIRNGFDIGKDRFNECATSGYSQGDCAVVVYDPDDFGDGFDPGKMFRNLIWDSPIYARLTVAGEEHDLTEDLEDAYDWNRDAIVAKLATLGLDPASLAWAVDAVPRYPEYL